MMEASIHMFASGDKNPLAYYRQVPGVKTVSYTHLTLPTSDLV